MNDALVDLTIDAAVLEALSKPNDDLDWTVYYLVAHRHVHVAAAYTLAKERVALRLPMIEGLTVAFVDDLHEIRVGASRIRVLMDYRDDPSWTWRVYLDSPPVAERRPA